jgi:tRNA (cmo5U34)-methyltransferase
MKSTVDEIRQRFDADVERFSNLETGQSATIDAPLAMALVAEAATTPTAMGNAVEPKALRNGSTG